MVLGLQEIKSDFSYLNASHVGEFTTALVLADFFVLYVNLVFAQIFDEEALLVKVPEYQRMFLAQCVSCI